jgi:hypothetical protein
VTAANVPGGREWERGHESEASAAPSPGGSGLVSVGAPLLTALRGEQPPRLRAGVAAAADRATRGAPSPGRGSHRPRPPRRQIERRRRHDAPGARGHLLARRRGGGAAGSVAGAGRRRGVIYKGGAEARRAHVRLRPELARQRERLAVVTVAEDDGFYSDLLRSEILAEWDGMASTVCVATRN